MTGQNSFEVRRSRLVQGIPFPLNLGDELGVISSQRPDAKAVVVTTSDKLRGTRRYPSLTFDECWCRCEGLARGLADYGLGKGDRVLLLMRPMLDFVPTVFALWKIGAVVVTVDPGASREQKLNCVRETEPKGLIGIPIAQSLRALFPKAFASVTHPVTAGRRMPFSGPTLRSLLQSRQEGPVPSSSTTSQDELAIVFTSGSTGAPKGVVYTHGNGAAVVQIVKEALAIGPEDVCLACHPIFALYFVGMGATAVLPDLDPRFPAKADPERLLEIIHDQKPSIAFVQLSILHRLVEHCLSSNQSIPHLKKVMTTGASVSLHLIQGLHRVFAEPGADVVAMYGATEALGISFASGREILQSGAARMQEGKGTYLGRPSPYTRVEIIRVTDRPIDRWEEEMILPPGEIGEVCVSGPVVTPEYRNRPQETLKAKIRGPDAGLWQRMGDAGVLDENGCLWYCGRIQERVVAKGGTLYSDLVEPLFNQHHQVRRSALIGLPSADSPCRRPTILIELDPRRGPSPAEEQARLCQELMALAQTQPGARQIEDVLIHQGEFPLDVRHNAKIRRDILTAQYAAGDGARKAVLCADRRVPERLEPMSTIRFKGFNIHYHENGEGEALLFLHNAANDHWIWEHQLEYFSPRYRVVAPDSLGYGRSDSPRIDYTLSMYAEMVATIVDTLSLAPVTIIGNCTGSSMALAYAQEHSEKVRRLVLFNVATDQTVRGGNIYLNYLLLRNRPRVTRWVAPLIEASMRPRVVSKVVLLGQYGKWPPPKDPQFADHARYLYRKKGTMSAYASLLCCWEGLRSLDEIVWSKDLPPLHIIWGESNRVLRAKRGRAFCERIRPDTAEFIQDCGHLAMREKPDQINQILEELLKTPARRPTSSEHLKNRKGLTA